MLKNQMERKRECMLLFKIILLYLFFIFPVSIYVRYFAEFDTFIYFLYDRCKEFNFLAKDFVNKKYELGYDYKNIVKHECK